MTDITDKLMEELKNCPFCGECGCLWKRGNYYTVECCGCSCEQSCGFVTKQAAITAWNTRAPIMTEPKPEKQDIPARLIAEIEGLKLSPVSSQSKHYEEVNYGIDRVIEYLSTHYAPASSVGVADDRYRRVTSEEHDHLYSIADMAISAPGTLKPEDFGYIVTALEEEGFVIFKDTKEFEDVTEQPVSGAPDYNEEKVNLDDLLSVYSRYLRLEGEIEDTMIESGLSWERTGYDDYDSSIEFYGVAPDDRLSIESQDYLKSNGFARCWLNHKDGMETYYVFPFPQIGLERIEKHYEAPEHRKQSSEPQIQHLKAENERLRGEREWKDISSAPKNGDEILILFASGYIEKVEWDSERKIWQQCCDNDLKVTTRGAIGWQYLPQAKPPQPATPLPSGEEDRNEDIISTIYEAIEKGEEQKLAGDYFIYNFKQPINVSKIIRDLKASGVLRVRV